MNERSWMALSERVHRGHTGQAPLGYWCGGWLYGYNLNDIDPFGQQGEIVRPYVELPGDYLGAVRLLMAGIEGVFEYVEPCERDAYGQPARIGTVLEVDADQAAIVAISMNVSWMARVARTSRPS